MVRHLRRLLIRLFDVHKNNLTTVMDFLYTRQLSLLANGVWVGERNLVWMTLEAGEKILSLLSARSAELVEPQTCGPKHAEVLHLPDFFYELPVALQYYSEIVFCPWKCSKLSFTQSQISLKCLLNWKLFPLLILPHGYHVFCHRLFWKLS